MLGKTSACALLAAILLLAPGIALAAPLSPTDRNTIQQQQQQQQQQQLDESQRQRESLERSVVVPRPVHPDSTATPQGPCFAISRIELMGANLLHSERRAGERHQRYRRAGGRHRQNAGRA